MFERERPRYLKAIPATPRARAKRVRKLMDYLTYMDQIHKNNREEFDKATKYEIIELARISNYQRENGELGLKFSK